MKFEKEMKYGLGKIYILNDDNTVHVQEVIGFSLSYTTKADNCGIGSCGFSHRHDPVPIREVYRYELAKGCRRMEVRNVSNNLSDIKSLLEERFSVRDELTIKGFDDLQLKKNKESGDES